MASKRLYPHHLTRNSSTSERPWCTKRESKISSILNLPELSTGGQKAEGVNLDKLGTKLRAGFNYNT